MIMMHARAGAGPARHARDTYGYARAVIVTVRTVLETLPVAHFPDRMTQYVSTKLTSKLETVLTIILKKDRVKC